MPRGSSGRRLRTASNAGRLDGAQRIVRARAWALELAADGQPGIQIRNRMLDELAMTVRGAAETRGTSRPFDYYVALMGGCHELVYRYVSTDRIDRLGELEEPMVDFLVAVLAAA